MQRIVRPELKRKKKSNMKKQQHKKRDTNANTILAKLLWHLLIDLFEFLSFSVWVN